MKVPFVIITILITVTQLSCQQKNADAYLSDKNVLANIQLELNDEARIPDPADDIGYMLYANSHSRLKTVEALQKNGSNTLHKTWHEFDSTGKPLYSTYDREKKDQPVRYIYDGNNRLTMMVDSPRVFVYTYDSIGRLASRELKGRHTDIFTYNDTATVIERTEVMGMDISPTGTVFNIPGKKSWDVVKYNDQHLPVYKSNTIAGSQDRLSYDSEGKLLIADMDIGGMNITHKLQYNDKGLLVKKEVITNGKLDLVSTYNYTFKTQGNNIVATVEKEMVSVMDPTPAGKQKTTLRYLFDPKGNWISKIETGNPVETVRKIEYY